MSPVNNRKIPLELSPQIIVGAFVAVTIFSSVFVEHALKDDQVAGSHIHYFKADIKGVGVNMIRAAPSAAGDKYHGVFIGDIGCEFNMQAKVLPRRDLFLTIQFEATCTDVGKITEQFLRDVIGNLHVICKVTSVNFSLVVHMSLLSINSIKYVLLGDKSLQKQERVCNFCHPTFGG